MILAIAHFVTLAWLVYFAAKMVKTGNFDVMVIVVIALIAYDYVHLV